MTSREDPSPNSPAAAEAEATYAAAWDEWSAGGDEELWETTTGDGIEP